MKIAMVRVVLVSFLSFLTIFFFYWSSFPIVDMVNVHPFGFPRAKREPFFVCKIGNVIIRAYHGYGSSVTTSDTDSVYLQSSSQPFERVIWRAYSSPLIDKILCEDEQLVITTGSDDPSMSKFAISINDIQKDLLIKPVSIYKGKLVDNNSWNGSSGFCLSITILPGILCVFGIVRILKKK